MKYVIEVPDDKTSQDIANLFIEKYGSKTWIMVSPYDRYVKAEIRREQEHVWDFARKITEIEDDKVEEAFDVSSWTRPLDGILQKYSYAEAYKMYKVWGELKIGDVVVHNEYERCVLLEKKNVESVELWAVIDEKGCVHQINRKNITAKIADKHFQEVETLIKKLKEMKRSE